MISDFNTNSIYFSERLKTDKRFKKSHDQLIKVLTDSGLSTKYLKGTNDIWARDYMPIQVSDNKFIEYRYDPDYLQGDSDDTDTRETKSYPDVICGLHHIKTQKSKIILDGGNVVKSNNCIILTDKIIWENKRLYTSKQLINKLHEEFEVEKVVLIPWDEECEFGHSDGMLRFINNKTVLISGFYEQFDKKFKKAILKPLKQAQLDWEWFRCSDKEDEDNLTYINFLLTKDILIIPELERPEDKVALSEFSRLFPSYADKKMIKTVNSKALAKLGGALNCISWTIKE